MAQDWTPWKSSHIYAKSVGLHNPVIIPHIGASTIGDQSKEAVKTQPGSGTWSWLLLHLFIFTTEAKT